MKKCVFFDRDGVVNRSPGPGYVETWEEFELMPDFPEALRAAMDAGYIAIVITNQRGVARGMIPKEVLEEMHENLQTLLRDKHGLEFADIFYCPHDRDTCDCRKPLPGMLLAAAEKHDIDLQNSWMIGDNKSDIQTGKSAGCRTIKVTTEGAEPDPDANHNVSSLKELEHLLRRILS